MTDRPRSASTWRSGVCRAPRRGDDGFTLVEVVIAMVIVFVVMSAMLTLYVGSLGTTVAAKQRQAASAVATQNLERLRALPYDVIRAGLNSGDLAGDANVSGSSPRRLVLNGISEQLVLSSTQTQQPLYPHRRVETVDGVAYTVAVYVTQGSTTNPSYQLTSVVSWAQAASGTPRQIVQRSTAYSAEGCLSLSNRPFSGPCQAGFSAVGGITSGRITVSNATDSTAVVPGTGGSLLALDMAGLSTNSAVEQTVTVSASARTVGAGNRTTSAESTSGGLTWSSNADTDPSSPSNGSNSSGSTVVTEPSAPDLTLTGTAGMFTAVPSKVHQATVSSEVAGTGALCTSVAGVPMTTGQPCASAGIRSSATAASLTYDPVDPAFLVAGVPSMTLASVDTSGTPSRSVSGRLVSTNGGHCPGTSGDGCSFSETSRTLGTITLGGFPARLRSNDQLPAGLANGDPLVRVTGLTESARSESGHGARVPQLTRGGTLQYWNGSGYASVPLSSLAAGSTYALPDATATYRNVLGLPPYLQVTARAVVQVGAVKKAQTNTLPCNDTTGECTSSASSDTALAAQVEYVVTRFDTASDPGTEVTRFVVVADLGTVTATTYYQAAPAS